MAARQEIATRVSNSCTKLHLNTHRRRQSNSRLLTSSHEGANGRYSDDVATLRSLIPHLLSSSLYHVECAVQVDAPCRVPNLVRDVEEAVEGADTCIGYERVDATKGLDCYSNDLCKISNFHQLSVNAWRHPSALSKLTSSAVSG